MESENSTLIASQLRTVLARLNRKLRKLSPSNTVLSQTERSVLVLLEQHDYMLSAELAGIEKITPQSMGALLNHLDELKLISKTASESDRRKIHISLSESGKQMLEQVRHERDEWLSKALAEACTPQEQLILKEAIGPLTKLVNY
ncbi:MarR family winged helix-turn-helix transcriptional regulator [Pedobacter endophyticus]|uniref:MarR family transcriptional regulator n=1 Tax=Pedobacter endophyticus TaxID=2789740 RepID=A0A7S9L3L8_9SPHI|nr:MarR family transcriptional regulator [Pedobacter endophyticus]QPH41659.1 MarR family transcriptional regulator [Pedobacter endophyticus]